MGDKLGTLPARDFNLMAGDAGPCQSSAQQVPVLIHSIGLNRGTDELLHKLCTQVLNENLDRNRGQATEQSFVFSLSFIASVDYFHMRNIYELFINHLL